MDKVLGLEVTHPGSNLCGDVHEHHLVDLGPVRAAEVVKEVSPRHELGDDVKWRLPGAHAKQLK